MPTRNKLFQLILRYTYIHVNYFTYILGLNIFYNAYVNVKYNFDTSWHKLVYISFPPTNYAFVVIFVVVFMFIELPWYSKLLDAYSEYEWQSKTKTTHVQVSLCLLNVQSYKKCETKQSIQIYIHLHQYNLHNENREKSLIWSVCENSNNKYFRILIHIDGSTEFSCELNPLRATGIYIS